ncbi:MAG: zinc metalloprotease HtpX [Syntrophomonadaceae bacterium]|nr:zinc metalloprotease HtpX [Syntrophomonadaceae bacterium]
MNNFRLIILMGGLSVILVIIGNAIGGSSGAMIFLGISLIMNLYSFYNSDKLVIKMTKSRPLEKHEAPEVHNTVKRLADRAGLPMPRLYLAPSQQPNAFATGRNPEHSAVAVTAGLLNLMNQQELEGVLAHELAHIKNRDILIGSVAAAMAGAISMIANIIQWGAIFGNFGGSDDEGGGILGLLAMAILAPIAAMIIQMAISRSREYAADETGARITGNPRGLASALLKLEKGAAQIPMQTNPSTAHMYIMRPFSARGLQALFSTHPSTSERVETLQQMIL